jgi:hypothetical protein
MEPPVSASALTTTSPRVAGFFQAVDARLAQLSDDADKAQYLLINLDRARAHQRQLGEWVETDIETRRPISGDAFELSAIVDGLENRRDELRASIRSKIATYEAKIAPIFTVIQGGRA